MHIYFPNSTHTTPTHTNTHTHETSSEVLAGRQKMDGGEEMRGELWWLALHCHHQDDSALRWATVSNILWINEWKFMNGVYRLPHKTLPLHSARYTQCIRVSSRNLMLRKASWNCNSILMSHLLWGAQSRDSVSLNLFSVLKRMENQKRTRTQVRQLASQTPYAGSA